MGNCKDCKNWDKNYHTCDVDWVNQNKLIVEDNFALYADAHDDSGLQAGLKTGPMFGCVKFKLKV